MCMTIGDDEETSLSGVGKGCNLIAWSFSTKDLIVKTVKAQ